MTSPQTARRSLVVLLFAATALIAVVVRPLAAALFLAAVLAGLLWPLQQRFARLVRGSRGLAAGIMVLATTVLVTAPILALSVTVVREAAQAAEAVSTTLEQAGVEGLLRRLPAPLSRLALDGLHRLPRGRDENIDDSVQRKLNEQGATAIAVVGTAITATGSLAFQTVMMIIALYFLLYQGDQLVAWVDTHAPLKRGQTRELLLEFQRVSSAVITSTIVTAGAQAGAALIGYLIVGVPHPIVVTTVTFFVAMIPAIGAGVICLAVAGLVALTGQLYSALFLAIWGIVVVGLTDNLVRPLLIKNEIGMHGAIVFFALIGGVGAFGALGLLIGPLAVSMFLAVLRIHERNAAANGVPARVQPALEKGAHPSDGTVRAHG